MHWTMHWSTQCALNGGREMSQRWSCYAIQYNNAGRTISPNSPFTDSACCLPNITCTKPSKVMILINDNPKCLGKKENICKWLLRGEDHRGLKGLELEPIKSMMSSSNVEAPQRLGLLLWGVQCELINWEKELLEIQICSASNFFSFCSAQWAVLICSNTS